ncbi:unnamed protein product [Musa acuminata subsp. burmannicoides]
MRRCIVLNTPRRLEKKNPKAATGGSEGFQVLLFLHNLESMGNTVGMPLQAKSPDPSATSQVLAAAGPTPDSKPKKKICCACPDTKRLRDECIVENGEAACEKWIQAHLRCLRAEGFKV